MVQQPQTRHPQTALGRWVGVPWETFMRWPSLACRAKPCSIPPPILKWGALGWELSRILCVWGSAVSQPCQQERCWVVLGYLPQ